MANDAHATGGTTQELLYDASIPTPDHAERARTLADAQGTGTLGTLSVEPDGFPYGSFVTFALWEGQPVFLISDLAEHTKNLRNDGRASLLIVENTHRDALANGRVTLLGRCAGPVADLQVAAIKDAYLKAHPNAAYYVEFKDFSFWKLNVESVRYIGGYGRMSWVDASSWVAAEPDPMVEHHAQILAHMNRDHADTMVTYCKAFSRASDTTEATMTSIDRYGFEMSAMTGAGPRPIRVAFPEPIASAEDARTQMVALARKARPQ